VQTCIVHLVRSSLRFVPYKDRRAVAADLKLIYTATDQDAAADQLAAFAERWDHRFPTISRSWLTHWEQITPFLAFPPDVRRAVYTTSWLGELRREEQEREVAATLSFLEDLHGRRPTNWVMCYPYGSYDARHPPWAGRRPGAHHRGRPRSRPHSSARASSTRHERSAHDA
jgi:hypothetical protein